MRALKVIYVLAIAAALIALVVVGIHTFYPAPSYSSAYEQEIAAHDRNVFLIALPLGVALGMVGAFVQRRTSIFGAGLVVGGIGAMIFAVTPYHLDRILAFIGIAVILAVLIVGYKFSSSLRRS